ncbi:hypothetical protein MMC30_007434 [Trapelia coarctata]|nr:hypothetical protein [Trapelia coarctata]
MARGAGGMTILHNALAHHDSSLAEFLLDNGADIDATDDLGRTALYSCFFNSNTLAEKRKVHILILRGANVNRRAFDGTTLLHVAARSGSVGYLGLLLNSGADPTVRDADGETPLDIALRHGVVRSMDELGLVSLNGYSVGMSLRKKLGTMGKRIAIAKSPSIEYHVARRYCAEALPFSKENHAGED